jgi:1,4-dihydroxy-2-naphthoate octaprenyltransferase
VIRETLIFLFAGPFSVWGRLNHLIPFRLALAAGRRSRQSAADPAMRTIVAGAALVIGVYAMQAAVVAFIFGPWWGLAYVLSLPLAADVNLRLGDRARRARGRARTYLMLRRHSALREELQRDALQLRGRLLAIAGASPA